jgi:hypothetical protein
MAYLLEVRAARSHLNSEILSWKTISPKPYTDLYWLVFQFLLAVTLYLILFGSLGTNVRKGASDGLYSYLGYWFRHQTGEYRLWGVWWYYLPRLLLYETLPMVLLLTFGVAGLRLWWKRIPVLLGGKLAGQITRKEEKRLIQSGKKATIEIPKITETNMSVPLGENSIWKPIPLSLRLFSLFQLAFFMVIYALLNEKVPWLMTYQAYSVNLAVALFLSHWLAGRSPGTVLSRIGSSGWPTTFSGLVITVRKVVPLLALLGLVLFSVRQYIPVVFLTPDDPRELLVYTQTTHLFAEKVLEICAICPDKKKDPGAETTIAEVDKKTIALEGESEWPCAWYFRNKGVRYKRIDPDADFQLADDTPEARANIEKNPGQQIETLFLRSWWIWHGSPQALPGGLGLWANIKAILVNQRNDQSRSFPPDYPLNIRTDKLGFTTQILDYVLWRKIWFPRAGSRILISHLVPATETVETVETAK